MSWRTRQKHLNIDDIDAQIESEKELCKQLPFDEKEDYSDKEEAVESEIEELFFGD